MKSRKDVVEYLADCERKALTSLAANKWLMFGYWAAMAVHLRRVLKLSHTASPFRPLADLAEELIGKKRGDANGTEQNRATV